MRMAAAAVRAGGVGRALVMPNLRPPIGRVDAALDYRRTLQQVEPGVEYLMTLYLHRDLSSDDVRCAADAGIVGVKCYPRGVTTNSEHGVGSLRDYYPVFSAMQACDLVLNLHGEAPSDAASVRGGRRHRAQARLPADPAMPMPRPLTAHGSPRQGTCAWNAEERFLEQLRAIHRAFPHLRIVLEHVTTAAAVDAVRSRRRVARPRMRPDDIGAAPWARQVAALGPTVAATITAHHLELTVDDWAGQCHNYCRPVAKLPSDRDALRAVVRAGHPRFFFGSDSAPHPRSAKLSAAAPAGIYTSPYALPYLATTLDALGCIERLRPFVSEFGRAFYRLPPTRGSVLLERTPVTVPEELPFEGGTVVPFRAGQELSWRVAAMQA